MKTIYRKTYNPFRMEIIEKGNNEYLALLKYRKWEPNASKRDPYGINLKYDIIYSKKVKSIREGLWLFKSSLTHIKNKISQLKLTS